MNDLIHHGWAGMDIIAAGFVEALTGNQEPITIGYSTRDGMVWIVADNGRHRHPARGDACGEVVRAPTMRAAVDQVRALRNLRVTNVYAAPEKTS